MEERREERAVRGEHGERGEGGKNGDDRGTGSSPRRARRPRGNPSPPPRREEEKTAEPSESLIARLIRVATGHAAREEQEPSTNAAEMLRDDHRKVRALFREFESAGERAHATRKKIVDRISEELGVHAQIEEKIFYQAFRNVPDRDPRKVVRESFEEHKIVKTLLAELGPMEPTDEQFEAKVTVLKEAVEHHADEEEDELLPAAEKLFGEERLEELGREMQALRDRLRGQPSRV